MQLLDVWSGKTDVLRLKDKLNACLRLSNEVPRESLRGLLCCRILGAAHHLSITYLVCGCSFWSQEDDSRVLEEDVAWLPECGPYTG